MVSFRSRGVPRIRTRIFCGLYWCPLALGNYHVEGLGFSSMTSTIENHKWHIEWKTKSKLWLYRVYRASGFPKIWGGYVFGSLEEGLKFLGGLYCAPSICANYNAPELRNPIPYTLNPKPKPHLKSGSRKLRALWTTRIAAGIGVRIHFLPGGSQTFDMCCFWSLLHWTPSTLNPKPRF